MCQGDGYEDERQLQGGPPPPCSFAESGRHKHETGVFGASRLDVVVLVGQQVIFAAERQIAGHLDAPTRGRNAWLSLALRTPSFSKYRPKMGINCVEVGRPAISHQGDLAFELSGEVMVMRLPDGPRTFWGEVMVMRLPDGPRTSWAAGTNPRWGPNGALYVTADGNLFRMTEAGAVPEHRLSSPPSAPSAPRRSF